MSNVEIYINNSKIDLEGDEDIVQTYSVNSFADVSSRNSAYSNNIKAPFTANNKAILENAEIVVNDSSVPYTSLPTTIFVDSIPVVIGFTEVLKCKDVYELRVYGGNADFYSLIKGLKLSDLDLSDLNHDWTLANIAASRTNTEGYIYGIIDYHTDSPNSYITNASRGFDVRFLYFSVYYHTLIDRIVTESGYTLSGNLLTNEDYLSLAIPFSNDGLIRLSEPFLFRVGLYFNHVWAGMGAVDVQAIFPNEVSEGFFDNGGHWNFATSRYTASGDATISFSTILDFDIVPFETTISVRLHKNGVLVENLAAISGVAVNFAAISLSAGDYVEFFYRNEIATTVTINATGTSLYNTVAEDVSFGSEIDVALNLPDIKQGDFLKAILQKFGAIIQVNNSTQEIQIRQFSEIVDNITNAYDWSDKIDETEKTELSFKFDKYGQINRCIYKDDESVIKPEGTDYDLLIDNQNLKASNDLFVSPFAASQQAIRLEDLSIVQIKKVTNGQGFPLSKTEPRILYIRKVDLTDGDITYTDGTGQVITGTSIPLTHFILDGQSFNLGWENNLIPQQSSEIEDVLQNTKIIKELLRLNSADINQIDFFKPVWLDKHGCCFYISEISQYKMNKVESTIVELIKLT